MNIVKTAMQLSLGLSLSIPVLGGCAPPEIKWTEEVRLHDGKIIQIKRRMELTESGFPVQRRGRPKFHEFCYAPMGVYWKSRPGYRPELFDIVNGRAYAKVSLGHDCTRCMLHGYPESDALYFAWDGGAWKKVEYKDFPSVLQLNLLLSAQQANPADDAHGLVTLAEKEILDASISYELKVRGAKGLNELPETKGACRECRGIRTTTDETSEVFLPSWSEPCS